MHQILAGGSINNSLHINEHLDEVRLLICNNDETIKVFNIPQMTNVANIKLPIAVNSGKKNYFSHLS